MSGGRSNMGVPGLDSETPHNLPQSQYALEIDRLRVPHPRRAFVFAARVAEIISGLRKKT